MRTIKVSDVIVQARRLIFQPDPDNSNFSNQAILSFINEVKDDVFSDIPLLPVERTFIIPAVGSKEVTISDDVNRIESVTLNGEKLELITFDEAFPDDNIVIFAQGKAISERDGAHFRDNKIIIRPEPQVGDEVAVKFRGIPADFVSFEESLRAPGRTRQTFVLGTVYWLKLSLAREDNPTLIQAAQVAKNSYDEQKAKLSNEFSRSSNPRSEVVREVL